MWVRIIRLTFVHTVTLLFMHAHTNICEHTHTSPLRRAGRNVWEFGARTLLSPTPSRFPMQEQYESGPSRIQHLTLRIPETLWIPSGPTRGFTGWVQIHTLMQLECESCCCTVPEAAGNFSNRKPWLKCPDDGNWSKTSWLKFRQWARHEEQAERLLKNMEHHKQKLNMTEQRAHWGAHNVTGSNFVHSHERK